MELDKVSIGKTYSYFPPKENAGDNRHHSAIVEAVTDRVRVRIFMEGCEEGIVRTVSAHRLTDQHELL